MRRRSARALTAARRGGATRSGQIMVFGFLVLVSFLMLAPFVHELAKSFSYPIAVERGDVVFWPVDFTLGNYAHYLQPEYRGLWRAFGNSLVLTVVGTTWSVFFTAVAAYPLSKPAIQFRARGFVGGLVVFAIVFSPPMIPYFLAVRSYGLMDSLFALIATHTISPFNLILVRTYYRGLPNDLFEAATVEGAGDLTQLMRIAMPLAKPVLATITVYTAVVFWNIYLHALMFLRSPDLMTLQPYVRQLVSAGAEVVARGATNDPFRLAVSTRSALVIISILPMLIFYPFLQKHFEKGALLGSLK